MSTRSRLAHAAAPLRLARKIDLNNFQVVTTITAIVASAPAASPRLRGIAALVLQKHFGAPLLA